MSNGDSVIVVKVQLEMLNCSKLNLLPKATRSNEQHKECGLTLKTRTIASSVDQWVVQRGATVSSRSSDSFLPRWESTANEFGSLFSEGVG